MVYFHRSENVVPESLKDMSEIKLCFCYQKVVFVSRKLHARILRGTGKRSGH